MKRQPKPFPRGDRWCIKIELPKAADGKRRFHWRTFDSEEEAQRALTVVLADLERGRYQSQAPRRTVARWLAEWLPAADLTPLARERYATVLRHVTRNLGGRKLHELRPGEIAALWRRLLEGYEYSDGGLVRTVQPLARSTVTLARSALSGAMAAAIREDLLAGNPVRDAPLPKDRAVVDDTAPEGRAKAFTQAEVRAIFAHLDATGSWLYLPFAIACATGLRRGEILALTWADVQLASRRLRVRHNVTAGATPALAAPKTRASRRSVEIDARLVEMLREHCHRAKVAGLGLGLAFSEKWLVFPADPREPSRPRHPRTFSMAFARAIKALNLPRTNFHAARHFHATQLVAAGAKLPAVSKRLGHAKVAITIGLYVHSARESETEASALAADILGSSLGASGCSAAQPRRLPT